MLNSGDQQFWRIETTEEGRIVNKLLERRYPGLLSVLSHALETADPEEVVYPGNPNEYSDVVKEIVVLMDPFSGRMDQLPREVLYEVTKRAIDRCFGEPPVEERVQTAVDLIARHLELL